MPKSAPRVSKDLICPFTLSRAWIPSAFHEASHQSRPRVKVVGMKRKSSVNGWSLALVLVVVMAGISLGSTGTAPAQTVACTFFYPRVAFFYLPGPIPDCSGGSGVESIASNGLYEYVVNGGGDGVSSFTVSSPAPILSVFADPTVTEIYNAGPPNTPTLIDVDVAPSITYSTYSVTFQWACFGGAGTCLGGGARPNITPCTLRYSGSRPSVLWRRDGQRVSRCFGRGDYWARIALVRHPSLLRLRYWPPESSAALLCGDGDSPAVTGVSPEKPRATNRHSR